VVGSYMKSFPTRRSSDLIGQVHEVLSALVREKVPIRNLQSILGSLADTAQQTQDVARLTDAVRQSLGRVICSPHCRPDGTLPAIDRKSTRLNSSHVKISY